MMQASNQTHRCPIKGCRVVDVPDDKLMCLKHWSMVPRAIQRRVYTHWKGGAPTAEHAQSVIDAIQAVEHRMRML